MKALLIFYVLVLFFPFFLPAQNLEKTKSFPLKNPAITFSTSINQIFYVAEAKGIIQQYDTTGNPLLNYAPAQVNDISTLEARFGVKIYAFYQDTQSFTIFNRFLQVIEHHQLPNKLFGFAQVVGWSSDQSMWVWDNQEQLLKKYNPVTQEILLTTNPFAGKEVDISKIYEYQNRLYVFDNLQGIWVFDNLINLIEIHHDLSESIANYFGGEYLYCVVKNKIISKNLYNKENFIFTLNEAIIAEQIYYTHDKFYLFSKNKCSVFKK